MLIALFLTTNCLAGETEWKATCPVSGKPAAKEFSVKFKGQTLYFGDEKCLEQFKQDLKK